MNDPWVVEYNAKQHEYHMQALKTRNSMGEYGWKIIGEFNSRDEAFNAFTKLRDTEAMWTKVHEMYKKGEL